MNFMGEAVWELFGEDASEHGLPPGFRFHPTDEELITFYLAGKVFNGGLCGIDIVEVDLNRCEPWELPDVAKVGEREWYFFSLRDRKYPTGLRTNRATAAGYWKATGKDREVHSSASGTLVGMKKTLVFYMGRAPRGEKTKWVLHEYRLEGELTCRHVCKEEWVICRIFNKTGDHKKIPYHPNPTYFIDPSSSSSSTTPNSLPPFPELQPFETTPQTLTHTNHHPYLHQDQNLLAALPLPPFDPSANLHPMLKSTHFPSRETPLSIPPPPPQEYDAISTWLDTYLRTPMLHDMSFDNLCLPFGGGAIHDMSLLGPSYSDDCGPLVP